MGAEAKRRGKVGRRTRDRRGVWLLEPRGYG